jgi:hypothetical protein
MKQMKLQPLVAILAVVVLAAAVLIPWWGEFRASTASPAIQGGGAVIPVRIDDAPSLASVEREEVHAAAADGAPPKARSFDEVYADLVRLFRERPEQQGDALRPRAGAAPSGRNAQASELFAEMTIVAPDAGSRALMVLARLPIPWPRDNGLALGVADVAVCGLLLDFNLQQMTADPRLSKKRPELVSSVLAQMPIAPDFASLALHLLKDAPYLEAVHEQVLLDMARAATGEVAFLEQPVKQLLLTLWANLAKDGQGNYGDLLTYFDDSMNEVLRAAATQRLLASDQYRHIAVAKLVASGDSAAVAEAALFAAKSLPFATAIDTVRTLRCAFEHTHFSAYTLLVEKSPQLMVEHYQACLAESTTPRHREELVVAVVNYADERTAISQACLAFDQDPDPRVKGVALLGLANRQAVDEFRSRFELAVGDRALAAIPTDYLILSLRSIAPRLDANTLDRATAIVSAMSLSEQQRARVEKIRRDHLPR